MLVSSDPVRALVLDALKGLAASVREITKVSQINEDEWDALVTSKPLSTVFHMSGFEEQHLRSVKEHLQVIAVPGQNSDFRDFVSDDAGDIKYFVSGSSAVGSAAHLPDLDETLGRLARSDLLPLTTARDQQFGIVARTTASSFSSELLPDADGFNPILVGPNGLAYAAHYRRTPQSSVWYLPRELPTFRPWFELAFAEWHSISPATFPSTPGWIDSPEWFTPAEYELAERIDRARLELEEIETRHREELGELDAQMAALRAESDTGDRLLLSGQGDPLQDQVLATLIELGFEVEDMDQVWDPRERREDYRVRDSADPAWLVIADATGTTKGVKGVKLMVTQRFVAKWASENAGKPLPGYWVIANHFADRNPDQRPKALVRSDEASVLEDAKGLALDTVALFHLVRAVRRDPGLKDDARARLRAAVGQFTASDAVAWIETMKGDGVVVTPGEHGEN